METISRYLPEGPQLFPDDILTDMPEKFIVAEMIREKIFRLTRDEVPYSTAVEVESFVERENGVIAISAAIVLERATQKGIVIGAGGATLKLIGTQARREMERLFGVKIYLDLHVRLEPGWRGKRAFLDALDWRTMTGKDDV